MTEQEYLDVSNRVRVSTAIRVLSEIVPGSSKPIESKELRALLKKLSEWEEKLFEGIETQEDEE